MAVNHLDSVFEKLKSQKKKAFVAYLTAGYPNFSQMEKVVRIMDQSGVDVLELGIPFSDPVADGPTIQFSSQKSLEAGTTLKKIFKWAKQVRPKVSMPFVFMSYLNPILRYGLEAFAKEAARSGISGLIVPDLIPEEGDQIEKILKKNGIHMIYLVTPTTPRPRQKNIAKKSGGFIYAVSVTGVTGARRKYSSKSKKWFGTLSHMSKKPLCVGFGISGPKQVKELKKNADGFIVGSALIDVIRNNTGNTRLKKMERFVKTLAKECHNGR